MTTQDQYTQAETAQAQTNSMTPAHSRARTESPMEQTQPFQPVDESADGSTERSSEPDESSSKRLLFADDVLDGLRTRWDDVQACFVDDPRECVQRADALVADVVDMLVAGFTDARSRLEEQWARGEEASTEDLRIALKRYRAFFQRLLTV
ncbi:hypothetical protein [Mycobacterium sp. URHB0044]|jgi:hypothetical protein|uniref:hypothetical protein n=1 Tax=Mycobacterium sp. URHB0044 TaxID=1380386 RepID=UPI000490AA69|nr:hypothetical protein [Mycobacterium sp. URHB0044]